MPSTNVNVGLLEGRSSSRVLKPPGGGHSDIFGRGMAIVEAPVRTVPSKLTGIQACLYTSETKKYYNRNETAANGASNTVAEETVPTDSNRDDANGKQQEDVDGAVKEAEAAAKKPAPATPLQKVRVPPGGFSSGFW